MPQSRMKRARQTTPTTRLKNTDAPKASRATSAIGVERVSVIKRLVTTPTTPTISAHQRMCVVLGSAISKRNCSMGVSDVSVVACGADEFVFIRLLAPHAVKLVGRHSSAHTSSTVEGQYHAFISTRYRLLTELSHYTAPTVCGL